MEMNLYGKTVLFYSPLYGANSLYNEQHTDVQPIRPDLANSTLYIGLLGYYVTFTDYCQ